MKMIFKKLGLGICAIVCIALGISLALAILAGPKMVEEATGNSNYLFLYLLHGFVVVYALGSIIVEEV